MTHPLNQLHLCEAENGCGIFLLDYDLSYIPEAGKAMGSTPPSMPGARQALR